jgi:hypothetical protein
VACSLLLVTAPPAAAAFNVSDIVIPADVGYVMETHPPARAPAPVVVLIQEAHTHDEGQQHIVGILEALIRAHGLKLILVEGSSGEAGLSYLRDYGPPSNRKQVAEKYLARGLISAEEYLDMTVDDPLILWGVERKDLYERHVDTFLQIEALQGRLRPAVASLRRAVDDLKPRLMDPAVGQLDTATAAFNDDRLGVADYAQTLRDLTKRARLTDPDAPHMARFLAARQFERTVDLKQVQADQQALMQQLSTRVPESEWEALITDARRMKAEPATRDTFYKHLERLAVSSGVSLDRSPALAQYLRYLARSAQINPAALAAELDQLSMRLRGFFSTTSPQSRELHELDEQLALLEKLVDLKLSPEEYPRMTSLPFAGLLSRWTEFLHTQGLAHGLPSPSFPRFDELEAALPILQRFYHVALERDEVLADNAVKQIEGRGEPLSVLIIGGFHSTRITQRLKDRGLGVVVVVPKVSRPTDDTLYASVLKFKRGIGSVTTVQAAAKPVGAVAGSP